MPARLRFLARPQIWLSGVLVVVLAAHLAAIFARRTQHIGDFDIHRKFGARFLSGPPLYEDGLCFNYMPVVALYYVPLALLPAGAAFALRYLVALGCLGLSLRWLYHMLPRGAWRGSAPGLVALTLVFASKYLIRDLDDGGPHLILLAMLVGGTYCAWRGRAIFGGVCFGLAIALKMTPALLLPYLAWKRQWKLLGATAAAGATWTILPACFLGPDLWWHYQQQWNQVALDSFTGTPDVSSDDNDLRVQNQSLKLAFMHLFSTYPEGHPLRPAIGYWSLLDMSPALARLATAAGLALVLGLFWWATRRADGGMSTFSGPVELGGLFLLMLLLSPVTRVQHLVWTVPALFFIIGGDGSRHGVWTVRAGLGLFLVLTMILNREVLGRDRYVILLASHIHTVALLILLGLVLRLRRQQGSGGLCSHMVDMPHRPMREAA